MQSAQVQSLVAKGILGPGITFFGSLAGKEKEDNQELMEVRRYFVKRTDTKAEPIDWASSAMDALESIVSHPVGSNTKIFLMCLSGNVKEMSFPDCLEMARYAVYTRGVTVDKSIEDLRRKIPALYPHHFTQKAQLARNNNPAAAAAAAAATLATARAVIATGAQAAMFARQLSQWMGPSVKAYMKQRGIRWEALSGEDKRSLVRKIILFIPLPIATLPALLFLRNDNNADALVNRITDGMASFNDQ